ncbi:unnamed protein product [Allacma fusca]|uniref:Peroxisomal membrane protein PMP34 n=1 Tax=Allacma fusca TaxID=39272 RepID=A0A8J2P0A9_9HEXA|nr:unnamed protein product [Allacma fusca]
MSPNNRSLFSYETLVHAIAGSVGSVTAMTTFYPLDTVRSRLQLEETRVSKGTLQTLIDLMEEEGFRTLYRGLKPTLQSLCVSNFVYFYTFHALKRLRPSTESSALRDLLFGSVAGVINVLSTTPLWVVNTRVKMQGIRNKEFQDGQHFKGLIDGLYKIYKADGILALWSGTVPSLMLVINPAIQFMTYESIKRRFSSHQLSSFSYFMIAAVAKTIATVLTYPLQLIQTRMRHGAGGRSGGKSIRKNLANRDNRFTKILMNILKTQGLSGLFKGMESKILQTVLTSALMFVIYEKIQRWVRGVLLAGRNLPKT